MVFLSRILCGMDEAGRGPLAGPVVAAAVVLPSWPLISGVGDSKAITPAKREKVYRVILEVAQGIGIGVVSAPEIDKINILQANHKAMRMAVNGLGLRPDLLLVDGLPVPDMGCPQRAVVGGDARCYLIGAASIVAKVFRDRLMQEYDRLYPQYGFARNKGYGTAEHLKALRALGPCPIHRRSFRGVTAEEDNGDEADGTGKVGRRGSGSLFTGTGL